MKLFSWFGKKPKTYKKRVEKFEICIVEEDARQLTDALGITQERAMEIAKVVKDSFDTPRTVDSIKFIFEHCRHENEIAFGMIVHQRLQEAMTQRHPLEALLSRFGA